MSVALLDKTRKINKLIHNSTYDEFNVQEILDVFEPLVLSDLYVIDSQGRIYAMVKSAAVNRLFEFSNLEVDTEIDSNLLRRIKLMSSTRENISPIVLGLNEPGFESFFMTVPLETFGNIIGYLLMYRNQSPYDLDDIILSENVGAMISLLLAKEQNDTRIRRQSDNDELRRVIRSLSETELKASIEILALLESEDGIIKISNTAEKMGVTRSVIVNAVKKMEMAGIISTKSCGPKGTFIKKNNDILCKEIVSLKEISG